MPTCGRACVAAVAARGALAVTQGSSAATACIARTLFAQSRSIQWKNIENDTVERFYTDL